MNKYGRLSQKASIGLVLIFVGTATAILEKRLMIPGIILVAIGIYLVSRE